MNNPYNNRNDYNRNSNESEKKSGMSLWILSIVVFLTELLTDLFKAFMIVGGMIALNLADVLMGTIGLTILFGGMGANAFGVPVWQVATAFSISFSGIQLYLWEVIERRGIGLRQILFSFKKLPKDTQIFIILAGIILVIDTFIDVSPIPLLVANSPYQSIPILYKTLVTLFVFAAILICGFAEIFTSGMRQMLALNFKKQVNTNNNMGRSQSQDNNVSKPANPTQNKGSYVPPSIHKKNPMEKKGNQIFEDKKQEQKYPRNEKEMQEFMRSMALEVQEEELNEN